MVGIAFSSNRHKVSIMAVMQSVFRMPDLAYPAARSTELAESRKLTQD
jgi:hypothetical protein